MKYEDTIVAVATPPGQGALGVVRMSGPDARNILLRLFRPRHAGTWRPRTMRYGHIYDANAVLIDEVLAVWMPAPRTYTGEEVVEISCHGGRMAIEQIVTQLMAAGARAAHPGEFTMRAFVAGRIDLSQAEAVMDVVQAQTPQALSQAHAQLQGWLRTQITELREAILYELAAVIARIDFPDDVDETAINHQSLQHVLERLTALIDGARAGMVVRDGATVVLIGRPNVGKSSLLNALLRHDRAIVSPIAGTTRDTLSEVANIHGIPIKFIDTAGIRDDSDDVIEQLGIARSRTAAQQADLALLLIDASQPLHDTDHAALAARGQLPTLLVTTKVDLPHHPDVRASVLTRDSTSWIGEVAVSSVTRHGIATLMSSIAQFFLGHVRGHDVYVSNNRHVDALRRCRAHLTDALAAVDAGMTADLVAVDMQAAVACLGEITGEDVSEALLDTVFARFCIGK